MNLDSVLRCHHCHRPNTRLVRAQAYFGPQMMSVYECRDRDNCCVANILRTHNVGAR